MRQNTKGFSLVELMIVVAIIGILAAIAIPNFVAMQAKSKRGELPGNVNAIKQVEVTYNTAFDTYLDASPFPTTTPAKTAVAWDSASAGTFTTMGFNPNGNVRGQYQVSATTSSVRSAAMPAVVMAATCAVLSDARSCVSNAAMPAVLRARI